MWKKLLLTLPAALAALSATALAQPAACSSRTEVVGQLARQYHEAPIAIGLDSNGGLVEVLTSSDGTTWTIIVTLPNGTTCLVAAGESWQPVIRVAADQPQI